MGKVTAFIAGFIAGAFTTGAIQIIFWLNGSAS